MIYNKEDLEIKYWGGDFVPYNDDFVVQKTPRKIKKKVVILTSFFAILVLIPSLVFLISKSQLNNTQKLTLGNNSALENKKTVNQNTINYEDEAKSTEKPNQTVEIINNDSYWKISKRTCGEGKFYLSIAQQNNNKALYKGESVTVDCKLN